METRGVEEFRQEQKALRRQIRRDSLEIIGLWVGGLMLCLWTVIGFLQWCGWVYDWVAAR